MLQTRKLLILALAGVVFLGSLSTGYALWFKSLTVEGTVSTGNVDVSILRAFTDDDGVINEVSLDGDDNNAPGTQVYDRWDDLSSADPAETGPDPKARYEKDVARCTAAGGLGVGAVTAEDVYPSYNCTAWFELQNSGSVPVKIRRITVSTMSTASNLDPSDGAIPLDLSGDILPDADFHVGSLKVCQQIHSGEIVWMDIDQHVLQPAPQGTPLGYTVDVEAAQYNELGICPDESNVCEAVSVEAERAALYQEALDILGPTGVILPLGDECSRFDSDTFTTVGATQKDFTWTEPPADFDTPPGTQGVVPVVTLNGWWYGSDDENAATPDDNYWTRGNGSSDSPFSLGLWLNPDTVGTSA